ncbi:MAG: hypothetical protein ACOYD9_08010 [Pyramidobacter sp.]
MKMTSFFKIDFFDLNECSREHATIVPRESESRAEKKNESGKRAAVPRHRPVAELAEVKKFFIQSLLSC